MKETGSTHHSARPTHQGFATSSRFLFLLYHYPPVQGTAAKRNERISSALAKVSSSSILFTAAQASESVSVSSNITVKQIPVLDYRRWLRRKTKDGALPESVKENKATQWLIRLINSFPINIIAGEGGLVYFIHLLREGTKAVETNHITHLYSSYRPFTDHYAAWWLKKRFPHLVWIADFRDLIIDPHYQHILQPKAHETFFKKIFSRADVLTTVSEGLAHHLRTYNKNVITVRNGIQGDIAAPLPQQTPYFTIAYTGSMFLDKRNAEPVFKAIQELLQETQLEGEDIRIVYAGKDGTSWKRLATQYRFESLLDDKGIVSEGEAKTIRDQACINLLLTISSDQLQGVLTGKMIECFQAGSPMLAIVVGQKDTELQSMMLDLRIGDCFSDQPEDLGGIKALILHEYRLWKKSGMNRKPVDMEILKSKYAMDVVMAPLLSELVRLSAISHQPSGT